MRFYIHQKTPKPKTSTFAKAMLVISYSLIYSMFVFCAVDIISETGAIYVGLTLAIFPILFFGSIIWWIINNYKACIDISNDLITVVEYPFGREKITHRISYSQIDHAEIHYYSLVKYSRVPYIVFFDAEGKILFRVIKAENTLEFQRSITELRERKSCF